MVVDNSVSLLNIIVDLSRYYCRLIIVDLLLLNIIKMGGIPPHQPKSNDFGRKISLCFE